MWAFRSRPPSWRSDRDTHGPECPCLCRHLSPGSPNSVPQRSGTSKIRLVIAVGPDAPPIPPAVAGEGPPQDKWQLGDDAIPKLCELLEAKGIKICAVSLPAKISGAQATIDTTDDTRLPVTVVNANHPGDRQRFTIAHELGHMYLDARRDLDAEVACQRFAGAFMVPAEILRREVGSSRRTFRAHPPAHTSSPAPLGVQRGVGLPSFNLRR